MKKVLLLIVVAGIITFFAESVNAGVFTNVGVVADTEVTAGRSIATATWHKITGGVSSAVGSAAIAVGRGYSRVATWISGSGNEENTQTTRRRVPVPPSGPDYVYDDDSWMSDSGTSSSGSQTVTYYGGRSSRRSGGTAQIQAAENRVDCGQVVKSGRLRLLVRTVAESYEVSAQIFKRTTATQTAGTSLNTNTTTYTELGADSDYESSPTLMVKDPTNSHSKGSTTMSFMTYALEDTSTDPTTGVKTRTLFANSGLLEAGDYKVVIDNGIQKFTYAFTVKACVTKIIRIDMTSDKVITESEYQARTALRTNGSEAMIADKRKAYAAAVAEKAAEGTTNLANVKFPQCCYVLPDKKPQQLISSLDALTSLAKTYGTKLFCEYKDNVDSSGKDKTTGEDVCPTQAADTTATTDKNTDTGTKAGSITTVSPEDIDAGNTSTGTTTGSSTSPDQSTTTDSSTATSSTDSTAKTTTSPSAADAASTSAVAALTNTIKLESIEARLATIDVMIKGLAMVKSYSKTSEGIGEFAGLYKYIEQRMASIEAELNAISPLTNTAKEKYAALFKELTALK